MRKSDKRNICQSNGKKIMYLKLKKKVFYKDETANN
jgi:hypothetical protein